MLSEAVKSLNEYFDIGVFDCEKFNNRPLSYDKKFYTKHIHTSVWGNEYTEYVKNKFDRIVILNGCAYMSDNLSEKTFNELNTLFPNFKEIMIKDFDFYKDYTNGVYLKENNLEEIQKIVSLKH